jgi:hypothetical protein
LNFVLAEIDLASIGSGSDVLDREGFRNGDEADGCRIALAPTRGSRDALADVRQPDA